MLRVTFTAPLGGGQHGQGFYTWVETDEETTDLLNDLPVPRVGFQAIKCQATIGKTTWKTSVFPNKGNFLLLVAGRVRKAENLEVDDPVTVHLDILAT
ncbi:MAG: DUF1905 domain-containing protein [Promicromonosporaceae bacterium]|nr:DUF1905 domain-containing protein [Promicromonosporaceae bacterium]